MNRNRWILVAVLVILAVLAGMLYGFLTRPSTTLPTPPPAVRKAAPAKKAVVKPAIIKPATVAQSVVAPAAPAPQINIYNGCCQVPPTSQPAPTPRASSPAPTAPPVPPTMCSEVDNYYCAPLPAVAPQSAPAASVKTPGRPINVLSGNTFQLNVLSGNGGGWHGPRYGSTYGWTPGHEELRFDPRTGVYYRVWVAHPHPGY